jgi:hypothetical protein
LRAALKDLCAQARRQPAFALYLAALAALGFKWLSLLSSLYARAIWADLRHVWVMVGLADADRARSDCRHR